MLGFALRIRRGSFRRQARHFGCDAFEANTEKYLKSTIAEWDGEQPEITYEDVDTSLIPPRPRLYGLVGADVIEQVWKERSAKKSGSTAAASS